LRGSPAICPRAAPVSNIIEVAPPSGRLDLGRLDLGRLAFTG
jgi:hypothetical protein